MKCCLVHVPSLSPLSACLAEQDGSESRCDVDFSLLKAHVCGIKPKRNDKPKPEDNNAGAGEETLKCSRIKRVVVTSHSRRVITLKLQTMKKREVCLVINVIAASLGTTRNDSVCTLHYV